MKLLVDGQQASPNLAGCTLVVPAVSIGNVGQLAMDLIIETSKAPRIGRLIDPSLIPCAGTGSYSHVSGIAYGMELFALPNTKTILMQQRAPAAPGLQQALADAVADWAKSARVTQIWVLGSLDGSFRRDDQLQGSQLRFYTPSNNTLEAICTAAELVQLEAEWFAEGKPLEQRLTPPWPLVKACAARGLPCAAVLAFVLEGDNVPDALRVANVVGKILPEVAAVAAEARWQQPPSWRYAFGGGSRPLGM